MAGESSDYVSESSSFCLFILPLHQDSRQKLELSLTWPERPAVFWREELSNRNELVALVRQPSDVIFVG